MEVYAFHIVMDPVNYALNILLIKMIKNVSHAKKVIIKIVMKLQIAK